MNPLDVIRDRLSGRTQKDLATELGVSPAYLNDVINQRKEPGAKILKALRLKRVVTYELVGGRR